MNKGKQLLLYTAKFLLLVIPVVCMVLYLGQLTTVKEDTWHIPLIEAQPDGAYDVILAGPSHMMYTVQPAQLFGEYGIASCNLGTPGQPLPASYFLIREMIQRHKPKLVVLEVFCANNSQRYAEPTRLHQLWDAFPLSWNKIQMVRNLVEENPEEYYFPVILYHSRWKELIREDYMVHNSAHNETFLFLDGVTPMPGPLTLVPEEDTLPIPELPLEYLKKLAQLCKETDTQLLLTVMPYRADWQETDLIYQRIFHSVAQLAQELDVDYLNTLYHLEEMQFDFMTDMVESSHVNASGGQKISAYFGNYLKQHYDLPDRSQDPDYAHWWEDYSLYQEALALRLTPQ